MRIISGKFRGKILIAPRNLPVRPTTDFAKEALFNLLGNQLDFDAVSVLDLFAGTGNISYEFASRGVTNITCVDASHHCTRFIKNTAEKLQLEGVHAIKADAIKFVAKAYKSWDVIFADPPYDFENYTGLIEAVFSGNALLEDGVFVLEHPAEQDFSEHANFEKTRKYGRVCFSFFKNK